jgi:hypothetical protein
MGAHDSMTTPADARSALDSVMTMSEAGEQRGAWPWWLSLLMLLTCGAYTCAQAFVGHHLRVSQYLTVAFLLAMLGLLILWRLETPEARLLYPVPLMRLMGTVVATIYFALSIARTVQLGEIVGFMAGVIVPALVVAIWFACDAMTLAHSRRGIRSARWRFAAALLIASAVAAQALPLHPLTKYDHRLLVSFWAVAALYYLTLNARVAVKRPLWLPGVIHRGIVYTIAAMGIAGAWRNVVANLMIGLDLVVRKDAQLTWVSGLVAAPAGGRTPLGWQPTAHWEPLVTSPPILVALGVGVAAFLLLTIFARIKEHETGATNT